MIDKKINDEYHIQLSPIKKKLQDVKDITIDNIDKVLTRGEKIEKLVENTEKLNNKSIRFYKTSRKLKKNMFYKRMRCLCLISACFIFFIYMLAFSICGNANLHNCH